MNKLDKDRLAGIIRREMEDCVGLAGGKLSSDRERLKNAYLGKGYGVDAERAENGWSVYVDRSVMETVEWAKGPLLKVFAGTDELVRFEPGDPAEARFAADATDYVNGVVFGESRFDLVYGPLTDGLYQRVGWAKAYFETKETSRVTEELEGLTREEALAVTAAVALREDAKVSVAEDETTGLYTAAVVVTERRERITVAPLPSERVIYSKDALCIENARFVAHWEDRMIGELLAEGYDKDLVESLPGGAETYPEEAASRRVNAFDGGGGRVGNDASRVTRVYEAYVLADVEGDGEVTRLKVVFAGGKNNVTILDAEEWTMYRPPLFAACSLPLPYSPVGLCLADLVVDVQALRTEMFRDLLDGMYLANHGEVVVNRAGPSDEINMDQFAARQAGGVYETVGSVSITPLPVGEMSGSAIAGLQLTEKTKEQRTGIGMQMQGLSADALQNSATGAVIAEEAQNQRLEMIARVYAETFFKPLARYVLALACKHLKQPAPIRRQGSFVNLTPWDWRPDMEVTVSVGLGTGNRQKKVKAMEQVMALQNALISKFGALAPVRSRELHAAARQYVEALGIEAPERYIGVEDSWIQAERLLMRQTENASASDSAGAAAAAAAREAALKERKLELEVRKAQTDIELKMQNAQIDAAAKMMELQTKAAAKQEAEVAKIAAKEREIDVKGGLALREMEFEKDLDSTRLALDLPKQGATNVRRNS